MSEDAADRTRRATFSVPDMDCSSCAGTVERSLDGVDGLASVDTRPTSGQVALEYDSERVTEVELVAAIERAGYEVDEDASDGLTLRDPATVWRTRRAIGVWIGAALLVVGLIAKFLLPLVGVAQPSVGADVPVLGTVSVTVSDLTFLAAVLTSGVPVVQSAVSSARVRSLDIDLLMGAAIVAATGIGFYVEAATLAVLYSMAELLESYAMDRTRDSLRELVALSPETATVLRGGEEEIVDASAVDVGEVVVVRPGDRLPVDGVIVEGESAVDESPITGESVPADRSEGDEVYAGSIAENGYLEVEATASADDSTLARIVELVQEAQAGQTEKEQFVDRFASYYTPIVVALALLTAAVPPLVIDQAFTVDVLGAAVAFPAAWEPWFVRGLTLLVISCPCALVISTPVSVASGVTAAAKNGVLIKGGQHLEAVGEVDAVALDKTGTLSKGELAVTDVVPVGGIGREALLSIVAGIEHRSEHPIAEAIVERARADGVDLRDVEGFEAVPGKGVEGRVDGTTYYAGKPDMLAERGVDLSHLHLGDDGYRADGGTRTDGDETRADGGETRSDGGETRADQGAAASPTPIADCEREDCVDVREDVVADLQAQGKTVVLVGAEGRLLGAIAIADELRPSAERAVTSLRTLGVERVVMLTGDNEGTARAVAEQVGVDEYRADLLPEEKVDAVEALQAEYGEVAMVGDGINDAPSLATADVGIAMGAAGTDTAIETADVALMGDDLVGLPYCYAMAGKASGVIRQNIWGSLAVKLVLAVGAPLGYVSVALAVLVGDMGMSLGVTGNAMRLSKLDPDDVVE